MPRLDRTGPNGQGPMTGGCFGLCNDGLSETRTLQRGRGRYARRHFACEPTANDATMQQPNKQVTDILTDLREAVDELKASIKEQPDKETR